MYNINNNNIITITIFYMGNIDKIKKVISIIFKFLLNLNFY